MEKFQPERPCVKCGGKTREIHWMREKVYIHTARSSEGYLRVECRTCGHSYSAAPLDAPENPS